MERDPSIQFPADTPRLATHMPAATAFPAFATGPALLAPPARRRDTGTDPLGRGDAVYHDMW